MCGRVSRIIKSLDRVHKLREYQPGNIIFSQRFHCVHAILNDSGEDVRELILHDESGNTH